MFRLFLVALSCAVVSACTCTPVKKCTTFTDCDNGQACVMGECRATIGTGAGQGGGAGTGGNGGGTNTGGGTGTGGGGGIVMGCDPNAGGLNVTRDTDCDGLSDAEEYGTDYNGMKTNPCNADSDGDGILDGVEMGKTSSVATACTTFTADADPNSKTNPTVQDTDGDGVNDGAEDANRDGRRQPTETDPVRKDTDCDGYSDGDELAMAAGCNTDGTKRDSDGDGLPDGVEGGLQPVGADPTGCMYSAAIYDADSSVKTNACNADSDGDGIQDGAEDTNLNGRVDMGELNPSNMGDGTGPVQQACATANLKPINFHTSGASDVQVALPPDFSEVTRLAAGGVESGFAFFDPATKVAGLAISKTPQGADATAEEANGRTRITGISAPLTQTFTTWDGFAGSVRATYDVSGNQDVKARLNQIAQNYLGMNVTGTLPGTGGVTGPFKIVAQYVRRTATRAVVVIAIIPANLYTGQALFRVDDTANGTALAQFGDFANTQCEVFSATVNAKVDFLWVVDDSCSMQSSQTAVANAGTLFGQKLNAAGLDWRAAGVTTGYFGSAYEGSTREWTNSVTTMQTWFSGGGAFGTGGDSSERGFSGVQAFMQAQGPQPRGAFRTDAQAHFIFLTDTSEQSSTSAAAMQTFISQRITTRAVAHGILCPEGGSCGDISETNPGKYHQLIRATGGVIGDINIFNPTSPTPQQQAQQGATIDAILSAVIGGTGTQLQRPPISSTIKVAVASTRGACNAADVPRDRTNGWDIDPATRRIVFFGNCIPSMAGVQVAVSYKYWNDGSPDANGDACGGTCAAPLVCDPGQRACVCAPNCGGCGTGFMCNTTSCACEPEIG
jgi:hypothetical protein